ncbi:MAG TPA: hypothetical protein VNJ02_12015 [Vicinamibacterales bacterium]|nr:hypothetical protein [Vicinamibacterales bacterium]
MNEVHEAVEQLFTLERFLRQHAVTGWADRIRDVRVTSHNDRELLKPAVLKMYRGTMGSLTDLIISRVNGHEVEDETAVNIQLDRLQDELWECAQRL